MILWTDLVLIQNHAVLLQPEQRLILRSICSTTVMPLSINIVRPFSDWCVCTWPSLHGIVFNFGSLTVSWFNMIYVLWYPTGVCVSCPTESMNPPSPCATFLWLLLLIYLLCFFIAVLLLSSVFAASLSHITDLPLESWKSYSCRHGTERVSSP